MSDYETLAQHNIELTRQKHQRTRSQHLRGLVLQGIATLPFQPAASDHQTILLIRPDHLGDTLLTAPAIRALAQAQPDKRLVALVGPWSAGVISAYPEIDLTLTLPFPGFARNPSRLSPKPYQLAWQWANQIRQLQAEAAIIFRPDHWWGAMLAKLAGIPTRIGFDLPDVAPFLTHALPYTMSHAVEHNMALVSRWTQSAPMTEARLYFPVEEQDRVFIAQKLAEAGLSANTPRVIIHPGSGTLIKQWPSINWAEVADRLVEQWGSPIIFTGGEHELPVIHTITSLMKTPAVVLAGETNIYQLAALYENARIVLGPDSGPLHLATAVNTPTVHLYGPADPIQFGPWGDPAHHTILTTDIGCRPCRIIDWPGATPAEHPCVRDITPDRVVAAALQTVN